LSGFVTHPTDFSDLTLCEEEEKAKIKIKFFSNFFSEDLRKISKTFSSFFYFSRFFSKIFFSHIIDFPGKQIFNS